MFTNTVQGKQPFSQNISDLSTHYWAESCKSSTQVVQCCWLIDQIYFICEAEKELRQWLLIESVLLQYFQVENHAVNVYVALEFLMQHTHYSFTTCFFPVFLQMKFSTDAFLVLDMIQRRKQSSNLQYLVLLTRFKVTNIFMWKSFHRLMKHVYVQRKYCT